MTKKERKRIKKLKQAMGRPCFSTDTYARGYFNALKWVLRMAKKKKK